MSFDVAAQSYDAFMGRFSEPLADAFIALCGVRAGQRALDVGCGPGALTERLVQRLGVDAVDAIDPSGPFVDAANARLPGLNATLGTAEALPFEAASFDLTLAQLVVQFMPDPVAGIAEMARVTQPDGSVAACVWDHGGVQGPLAAFWKAARELDSGVSNESELPGTHEGQLAAYFREAGLHDIRASSLTVRVEFATFDDWWRPFTLGVGPAGAYVGRFTEPERNALGARCRAHLPEGPFSVSAVAWTVVARP